MPSLETLTRRALDQDPATPVLEYQGRHHTWGELRAVADAVGEALVAAGLARAAPVAFVPRNRPAAIAAELGMVVHGFTIRMVHAFQSATGIARDVARAEVAAVVAQREDFTPELLATVHQHGLAAVALDLMGASVVEGAGRSTASPRPSPDGEPRIEVHTSGTTGPPKHVGFSFATIQRTMVGQNNLLEARAGENAPPVSMAFPLGNISGVYGTLPPLLNGFTAILTDRFSLDDWRAYQRRFKPATASLPAAGIRMVLDAGIPKEDLAHIKAMITGAAPLDPAVHRAFEQHYGIPILLVYGATEFGGPVAQWDLALHREWGEAKHGSVGRPYGGARLRIVDPETGSELPPDAPGLIEVVSPRVGDHWIRTTDMGRIDADGFLYHLGRADGAIMRGGFKLVPEVIERALLLHPGVAAAAVVGIPDPRLGEVPVAAIEPARGQPAPSPAELEAHLREQVYATHIPVDWRLVDELPRNRSVKTDLAAVRALFPPRGAPDISRRTYSDSINRRPNNL
ncbi:class I adenylate-forming enzyme family protein [Novosphingobium bradum]|uniref:Class I adenylate-forming enzyme family protein n=1 Tax=Novosphingobium bradum TaxID=1737444 RepID=A0ABV7IS17_9SPHN